MRNMSHHETVLAYMHSDNYAIIKQVPLCSQSFLNLGLFRHYARAPLNRTAARTQIHLMNTEQCDCPLITIVVCALKCLMLRNDVHIDWPITIT